MYMTGYMPAACLVAGDSRYWGLEGSALLLLLLLLLPLRPCHALPWYCYLLPLPL
jgi:hypothetical protein